MKKKIIIVLHPASQSSKSITHRDQNNAGKIENHDTDYSSYPDILSTAQAAAILGVSRVSVYKYIWNAEIFGCKVHGDYRIDKESVISYMKRRKPRVRDY